MKEKYIERCIQDLTNKYFEKSNDTIMYCYVADDLCKCKKYAKLTGVEMYNVFIATIKRTDGEEVAEWVEENEKEMYLHMFSTC